MADTRTELNIGAGGDFMDESLVPQSDGATLAKRPRVEIALGGGGAQRIVGANADLPVTSDQLALLLQEIRDDVREIRDAVIQALSM